MRLPQPSSKMTQIEKVGQRFGLHQVMLQTLCIALWQAPRSESQAHRFHNGAIKSITGCKAALKGRPPGVKRRNISAPISC